MTGPKPGRGEAATPRKVDTAAPDLCFLRRVFAELTGETPRAADARPPAAARSNPPELVRTHPKCLK